MDQRIIEFIAALRHAGVRISVAESADALRAMEQVEIGERDHVRTALQTTLVKEAHDNETFQRMFPLFFGSAAPPPMPMNASGELSEEEQRMLEEMLEDMLQNLSPEQIAEMFRAMMEGQRLDSEQLREMMSRTSRPFSSNPGMQEAQARRAMRELQMSRLEKLLQELLERLRDAGMRDAALMAILQQALQNQEALEAQVTQQVGQRMMQQEEEQRGERQDEMLDQPIENLRDDDLQTLRRLITKLTAQLRSRVALRQRRGKSGTLDPKQTVRTSQRFGGVPIRIRYRRRHLKPKLVVICDLSTSMRPYVTFLLGMIYALQDQVSRTRSFAFVSDLHDISADFADSRPSKAIEGVLERIRPGHYNTDLGRSLNTFIRDFAATADRRTTVIVLGDGRNNYNDPGIPAFEQIKRRARRVVWFTPEPIYQWGTGDSDMPQYVPLCDTIKQVSTLRELAEAVDGVFLKTG